MKKGTLRTIVASFTIIVGVAILNGCSANNDSSSGKGTVKLAMANATAGALALDSGDVIALAVPASYKARLVAVRLNRTRMSDGTLIWLNPNCTDEPTCTTDLTGGADGTSGNGSFFEFARPSAEINADLNSQGRQLDAGTYVDVSMIFCGSDKHGDPDDPTYINVISDDGSAKMPCTYASEVFATPLELKDGETVTVTLSYDLEGAGKTTQPVFVPSATKN
jgi:hypothetical protein